MSPVKGLSSSKTRKIAQANDSAHTNRETITTRLARANKSEAHENRAKPKDQND